MRILVYEFVTGGGYAGRRVPASLAREGLAMRTALVADLASIGSHQIVTTMDRRFRRPAPRGVDVVEMASGPQALPESLFESIDAVWLVAPETNRCLERLARRVERRGKMRLGSDAAAIRRASDKGSYPRHLARAGVRYPETVVLTARSEARGAAKRLGYPVVIKPRRGAGSLGVRLARGPEDLLCALKEIRNIQVAAAEVFGEHLGDQDIVMQRYVAGIPASVSLLADGRRAIALAVNAQRLRIASDVSYRGGRTPLEHPSTADAMDAAVRTCEALPGLRGYLGVDLVLTDSGPVVIEVNARLTTAYLGVRAALDENVAALAIDACLGVLPRQPVVRRRVRFTASGLVAAA